MAKGKKWLQALKTQSSIKERESTKGSIHLETGGMTSKKLCHSYSRKKGTFEKSVNQKFECYQEKVFLGKSFEKTEKPEARSWFQN